MNRSCTIAARVWWATLPYFFWVGTTAEEEEVADGARPCPWWAHPLAWIHRLVSWLGANPWTPYDLPACDCDYCRGVPGAEWTPVTRFEADLAVLVYIGRKLQQIVHGGLPRGWQPWWRQIGDFVNRFRPGTF